MFSIQNLQTNEDLALSIAIQDLEESISNEIVIQALEMATIELLSLNYRLNEDPFKDVPNVPTIANIFHLLLPVVEFPSFGTLEERKATPDLLEVRFVYIS
jgi:hypothetical protein